MCLINVEIEDGPTREEFDILLEKGEKMYFKIEDEYYPHRITDVDFLSKNKVKLIGRTLTGLFVATYDFKRRKGDLLTKYGRIVDDV